MFACLSKMFAWLVERRRVKINPCIGVHKPKPPKSRNRVLSDAEIVKFWSACEEAAAPFGFALKLLLLTGCRLNEVGRMERSELSDDGSTWTIPGERTKNHRTYVVHLARLSQSILRDTPTVPTSGNDSFVFSTNGRTPISGWSKTKKKLDAKMDTRPWRLHDLRRTCATRMAEIGIMPHIVEACLNHVSGAKASVAGVYNHAAYAPEKKSAFKRWASHIEGLIRGDRNNVVTIRRIAS
jgi:integrase